MLAEGLEEGVKGVQVGGSKLWDILVCKMSHKVVWDQPHTVSHQNRTH